jgi:replication factor C small subunit
MLWTEKYRPKKINEIIGQENFIKDANNWLLINDIPNLILYGQQGTGKTSASIALANEILKDDYVLNFLELNASDDRKLETVRTRIKDFASTVKLGNCPFKICLLDEMDGMTKDAQNALKRIMEKYSNNIRFIITCNDNSKIIAPIQSRCATYQFSKLDDKHIFMALNRILKIEKGEEIPTTVWMNQAYAFNGDLRKAITQMQAGFDSIIEIIDPMFEEIMIDSINNMCVLDKLHKLLSKGISTKDICNGLHDVILESRMDREIKYKYLRIIGETEYRSSTMTPKIIISWLATQMK